MPSLRVLYDVDRWAYHYRAAALQKYSPADFDVTISRLGAAELPWMSVHTAGASYDVDTDLGDQPPDLILSLPRLAVRQVRSELERRGWPTTLIGSWNRGWPLTIGDFHDVCRTADAVIVNNRGFWDRMGRLPGTHLLPNGVDLEIFHVREPLERRRPKVLWIGSELARSRKNYDEVLLPLESQLTSEGILCDFRVVDSVHGERLSAQEMAAWYNTGTVLVCASSAEGTPNTALEAAACGCTIVSPAVGNMPELIQHGKNGYLVRPETSALRYGVREAIDRYGKLASRMQKDIQAWSWQLRSREFFRLFRNTLLPHHLSYASAHLRQRVDLTERVTVFVTSSGAHSSQACLEHLRLQDSRFRLHTVECKSSSGAELERFLEECPTPFFVHARADMLLYPFAIGELYKRISETPQRVGSCSGKLLDIHSDRLIGEVRIFRRGAATDRLCRHEEPSGNERPRRRPGDGLTPGATNACAVLDSSSAFGLCGFH